MLLICQQQKLLIVPLNHTCLQVSSFIEEGQSHFGTCAVLAILLVMAYGIVFIIVGVSVSLCSYSQFLFNSFFEEPILFI